MLSTINDAIDCLLLRNERCLLARVYFVVFLMVTRGHQHISSHREAAYIVKNKNYIFAAPRPCKETMYGCCFDGKTTATGPHLQGCESMLNPFVSIYFILIYFIRNAGYLLNGIFVRTSGLIHGQEKNITRYYASSIITGVQENIYINNNNDNQSLCYMTVTQG